MKKFMPIIYVIAFVIGIIFIVTADTGLITSYYPALIAGIIISCFARVFLAIYFYFFVCRLFGVSLLEFLVVIAFSYIFYKLSFWHWSCIIKSLYLIALDFS